LPAPFGFYVGVGEVIKGWDQTVRQMHVGEKRRVIIPPELGYGESGIGPIPGGAKLYFEIELLELKPMPQFSEKQLEWLAAHPE
jgi:FKBP-type peptidyl-prolyl cis-trans isomerase